LDRQALGAVGGGDRCPYPRSFPNSISRSTARKLQADGQISFELGQLDSDEADRIVQEGLARFGRIDTLVNNAGIFIAKPFVDYTEEDFAKIFAVSVVAFFRLTRRVVPEMLGAHRADHD